VPLKMTALSDNVRISRGTRLENDVSELSLREMPVKSDTEHFDPDVIVVGGGSAGATATRRLVDSGLRVLLVEAGGADVNPAIRDPGRMHELWLGEEDWAFETVRRCMPRVGAWRGREDE
jgi:hypothetical protein